MSRSIPTLTIGVPVYNGARYLSAAIESLLAQTLTDFELLISDNASTDATPDIIRHYAQRDERIVYERQPVNRGAVWNFNRVLDLARAPYFRWHAHDDVVAPTHAARSLEALQEDPEAVLAATHTAVIDEIGNQIAEDDRGYPLGCVNRALPRMHDQTPDRELNSNNAARRYHDMLLNSNRCYEIFGMMRTDVVRRLQGQGPYRGSDKVLLVEMALDGRFVMIPEVLFFNRWHSERYSARADATAHEAIYHPTEFRKRLVMPRQVRCTWNYWSSISRARIPFGQRWQARGVFLKYLFQFDKWGRILRDAVHSTDETAVIPQGATRLPVPAAIAEFCDAKASDVEQSSDVPTTV